jgi:membrane-associated phospholipid phosphatase
MLTPAAPSRLHLLSRQESLLLQHLDTALFLTLNRGATNGFLDWLMPRITNLHHQAWSIVLIVLFCALVLWRGGRRARVWVVCALAATGLSDAAASRVVKALLPRERPCYRTAATAPMTVPDTRLLRGKPGLLRIGDPRDCPGSRSFPSNHASNMMALGGVCWWFSRSNNRRGLSLMWFLLPLVIGYSRIYLGYHYPSDVLGGWMLGALVAAAVIAAQRRFFAPGSEVKAEAASG